MADFKENIGKDGEPLNLIGVINMIKTGANKGGAMVRFEIDQSGFKNVVAEDGTIDAKKAAKIEPEPRITSTKGEYMTGDEVAKMLAGGHFVVDDKSGNLAGSLTATLKHGHSKYGWIPDADNITDKGYKPTAKAATFGEVLDRRDESRENAAAARAVAKGLTSMPDYSTPEAPAPEAEAPEAKVDTTPVATAAPASAAPGPDGPAGPGDAGDNLTDEVPF